MISEVTTMSNPASFPLFTFRVLVEFDGDYNVFVARCLETGSIATADDEETVTEMIQELLIDEATYALDHDSLDNLYSKPSPIAVWNRFNQAAHALAPRPAQRAMMLRAQGQEVSTEIAIAQTA
jgi:hypothetical protein